MIPQWLAPFANHVWQSTILAGIIWVLTLSLRRNAAQVRYSLWLTASIKFLLPFSLLVQAGSLLEWRPPEAVAAPIAPAVGQIAQTFGLLSMDTAPQSPSPVPAIAAAVWLAGFLTVVAVWSRKWLHIRRLLRRSRPFAIAAPVRAISVPALLEPGVFGVFRSILVVPEGIEQKLTAEQLRAVLAHELCHIRRRDNLAGAIHMVVEALFWFHPVVLWIGGRLVEERERACDEEVLRLGNRPEAYAEGILSVCKSYLESPMPCASGISGGKLKRRIEAIVANRGAHRLTAAWKVVLACAGTAAVAIPLLIGLVSAPAGQAQSTAFEVTSVKPADPNARGIIMQFMPGGGVHVVNATVLQLLTLAYEVEKFQISRGPGWIDSARFDVEGKGPAEETTPQEQLRRGRLRLQSLLAERFQLALHRDRKEGAVFALVVAKGGHKLKESDQGFDGLNGRPGQVAGERASMEMLAGYLTGRVGRPVLDRTGLTKTYRFKLDWFPEAAGAVDPEKAANVGATAPDPSRRCCSPRFRSSSG